MRFKIYDLYTLCFRKARFKILFFVFSILFLFINHKSFIINQTIFAADSSTSAKPSASSSATLIDKINNLKTEIASKAANLKLDVTKKIQNKAISGIVNSKTETELVIIKKDNSEQVIKINEFTTYQTLAKKPSLKDIDPEDFIVALGDLDDKNNLVAKKIVWMKKPEEVKRLYIWGQIQGVTNNSLTIKQANLENVSVLTNSNTHYFAGSDEVKLSDFTVKRFVVALAYDKSSHLNSEVLFLLPSGGVIKTATSSAKNTPRP